MSYKVFLNQGIDQKEVNDFENEVNQELKKNVLNKFFDKFSYQMANAVGAVTVFGVGLNTYRGEIKSYLDAVCLIGLGEPDKMERVISFQPTHKHVLSTYDENMNLIIEGFHANLIQAWHDFLLDLFSHILDESDSDEIKDFEFKKSAKDKIKILENLTGSNLDKQDKKIIFKNVVIRNVVQHNMGIIRKRDLGFLGINRITTDDGDRLLEFFEGDRIKISIYDLENFCRRSAKAAQLLTLAAGKYVASK